MTSHELARKLLEMDCLNVYISDDELNVGTPTIRYRERIDKYHPSYTPRETEPWTGTTREEWCEYDKRNSFDDYKKSQPKERYIELRIEYR